MLRKRHRPGDAYGDLHRRNAYKDFDPKIEQVAAWTIGGLVAGKVLAKVGVATFFLKFWKLIALGFVAAGGFIVKLFKRKSTETEPEPEPISVENTEKPEENNNA